MNPAAPYSSHASGSPFADRPHPTSRPPAPRATDAALAAEIVQRMLGTAPLEFAIVLGAGLAHMGDNLDGSVSIPYADLPGFPRHDMSGPNPRLIVGLQEGVRVAYLVGRARYHEAGHAQAMATPIEMLGLLGVPNLLTVDTAGSVNADIYPATVALITDHINVSGHNPLIGSTLPSAGMSLTEAYDKRLLRRLKAASAASGVGVKESVFLWQSGPTFETPAEARMARILGADLVGMGLVPEVILGRQMGLHVGAIALVTHYGAGFNGGNPNQMDTREAALQGSIGLRRLLRTVLKTRDDNWHAMNSGAASPRLR